MNFKLPVAGLMIGLLVACSETKYDLTVQSTPKQQQAPQSQPEIKQLPETGATKPTNPFDRASFPQDSCGDQLPNDKKIVTVNFYPVFINYNESNLQTVKANYCRDARKITRKYKGKEAIQVASFISVERAYQFHEFMKNKLGSGEIGEPTVIKAKRTPELTDAPPKLQESVGKAAQLAPAHIKQLSPLDKTITERGIKFKFKIVLPTYVPPGFQVDKLEVQNDTRYSPKYKIVYRNSSNSCFFISGSSGIWGGPASGYKTVEVSSTALGKVVLEYTDFVRAANTGYIGVPGSRITKGKMGYDFSSPGRDGCRTISIQEAVKVVESLQYLNP
jgi:hypothetical protein